MNRNEALLEAFADELRARRKKAGLSQEALADLADVNRTYIAKLELTQSQPTLSVMDSLSKSLDSTLPVFINSVFERLESRTTAK